MARPDLCGMCGMVCGIACGIETLTGQGLCGMCGINAPTWARVPAARRPTTPQHMRPRRNMPHMPHMPHIPCGAWPAAVRHGVRHAMPTPHAAQARSRALALSIPRFAREVGKGGLV